MRLEEEEKKQKMKETKDKRKDHDAVDKPYLVLTYNSIVNKL